MALTDKLTAIGDAIRDKTGSTDLLTLDAMPTAISGITTGGGADLPEEAFTITGDCYYRFANNGWNWFIENYKNKIATSDITRADAMFYKCTELTEIPFDINIKKDTNVTLLNMFSQCSNLKTIPAINNARITGTESLFYSCKNLRIVPDNFCDTWDWTALESMTSRYDGSTYGMFNGCYSLRSFPREILNHTNPVGDCSYSYLNGGFIYCYSIDELTELPLPFTTTWTGNGFTNAFTYCGRLKNLTFALQSDGTPYVMNWKSQTIDLINVGFATASINIYNYNSGITRDKEVEDDVTYQALKDDPDWFTSKFEYSRYNHDSAVATINSLPDTSAYLATQTRGTNTIKFKGEAGSATDGGAINTLTEEEIAVATAKGWTVTLS